ncbi:hypothetical protein ISS07_06530 [Candidatus Woesearchaeota archaeon]|nr:hypothetical protein [Candidatus Woesearchaeota archaeon]
MEHYELVYLKQKIEKGNLDVIKEMQEKIKDLERKHNNDCSTCSNNLDPYNPNSYTLMFGPEDFKKKASFCGLDCMEYFVSNMKHMKQDSEKTEF